MTFKQLVQERLPSRFLGAQILSVQRAVNHYALIVRVVGADQPYLIPCDVLWQYGLSPSDYVTK
jgi:hypothetical protein